MDGYMDKRSHPARQSAGSDPSPEGSSGDERGGRAAAHRRRGCLKCGRPFPSEWPGHRICDECKQTRDWSFGAPEYSLPAALAAMP